MRKLANLSKYINFVTNPKNQTKCSLSHLCSTIMIVETLRKIFNSFSVSTSGFLNEAFLSVLYGDNAEQVRANGAYGVEDIIVKNPNQYISVKTLEKSRLDIEGSLKLLQKSLDDDRYGNKVYYHAFIKNSNKDGKINNVAMYEISIDRQSIPVYYSDSVNCSSHYMGLVYIVDRESGPEQLSLFESIKKKPDTVDYNKAQLKNVLLRRKGKVKPSSEFRIPGSVWKKFVSPKTKNGLLLDLSEDSYKKLLNKAKQEFM